MKILADSSLLGLHDFFGKEFQLTLYDNLEALPKLLPEQDVLLCRTTLKVDEKLLQGSSVKYVATASSGTDHIDALYLERNNIELIDAKGCNAQAVADYVLACLCILSQRQLIQGNKLGIIGLGKVGTEVYSRLQKSDFKILGYDPLKEGYSSVELEELYDCDILCIHAALHQGQSHPSFNLINQTFLAKLKPGCILINAARGGIVNEEALLNSQTPLVYCTDVFLNEPDIKDALIEKATLCTPHIAGHSLEAKARALAMISEQLHASLGLPHPITNHPTATENLAFQTNAAWQNKLLSFYNPLEETRALKQAQDKKAAFLQLRKMHQKRHDFWVYFDN